MDGTVSTCKSCLTTFEDALTPYERAEEYLNTWGKEPSPDTDITVCDTCYEKIVWFSRKFPSSS